MRFLSAKYAKNAFAYHLGSLPTFNVNMEDWKPYVCGWSMFVGIAVVGGLTKTCRDAGTPWQYNPAGDALRDWSSAGWPPRRDTGRIRRRDTPGRSACRCQDN